MEMKDDYYLILLSYNLKYFAVSIRIFKISYFKIIERDNS